MTDRTVKIAVVCGGTSTEREISLQSGNAVLKALLAAGFSDVSLFDLKKDNIADLIGMHPDLAFLALHGKGGEDGTIQGALELAGIPYTGPGVAASAVCMNKILTKQILVAAGIPTARFSSFRKSDGKNAIVREISAKYSLPVVLKSPCQGSSIGVVIVREAENLGSAIDEIFSYGDQLLAEEYLEGTEVTLPIIGNDDPLLLPIIEITSEREFYDYKAKYTNGLCHHIIPARIPEKAAKEIGEIGRKTYQTLGCRGLSRIDFILDKKTGVNVMEINTLPGMTAMSLVPDSGRAAGISFEELVTKLVSFALEP